MHGLKDVLRRLLWIGMAHQLESLRNLLVRGSHGLLRGRIGLQEDQGGALLQLGEQLQSHGVVVLEASRQLIDQSRLHLDQRILITGQGFEFLHELTVGLQATQIGKVCPSCLGQQISIDGIRFRTGGRPAAIHGPGVDRVHRPACLKQKGDQQPMGGFDNASQVLFLIRTSDLFEKRVQFRQSFWRMIDTHRAQLLAYLINDQSVMFGVTPIDTSKKHRRFPSRRKTAPELTVPLYCGARSTNSLMIGSAQEQGRGSASCLYRSNRVEEADFPQLVQQFIELAYTRSAPSVERAYECITV